MTDPTHTSERRGPHPLLAAFGVLALLKLLGRAAHASGRCSSAGAHTTAQA